MKTVTKDKIKATPVCYFQCGKTIDTYTYARALVGGVSYSVCGEGCAKWPEGAVFIGMSTPGKQW